MKTENKVNEFISNIQSKLKSLTTQHNKDNNNIESNESDIIKGVEGKVKFFDTVRGYGFAEVMIDNQKYDIFIHNSTIQMDGFRHLEENQLVTMNVSVKSSDEGLESTFTVPHEIKRMSAQEAFEVLRKSNKEASSAE